ncbi:TPA: hypothetical protein ACF367_002951 [Vibrio parahaemolyticus]|uniref:hypothetical protein n=1 Tax=Vibrio parahaemolyticus TaxID=670 RepID=UPI0011229B90|nr:hypothetical protein [Vibrio parahaemolyticus]EGQ7674500.1 hypothetical protein [Vibrio parahaemolyticus]EGQ9217361.1 hypothetical protein [Vibrio parahaemolyticus]TOM95615.1 hypothetical protein CGH65_23120 [Vibrio parahaemolyticus]HBC3911899.1 hypothetical protein [Vibrio parahaemolyticus]
MSNSIVIRVLNKDDTESIVKARAHIQVEHKIVFEGETEGCTLDTSAFDSSDGFYPGAYIIVGTKP